MFISGDEEAECPVCLDNFKPGDKTSHLPCFETHMFHTECLDKYIEQSPNDLTCLFCRKPFKKEDVIKKELKEKDLTAEIFNLYKEEEKEKN